MTETMVQQKMRKTGLSGRKSSLLIGLYTTQMLAVSFVFAAVPAILRKQGADLTEIAWIYSLGLIWSIKFLWAPLIDARAWWSGGHYRGWLLRLQVVLVILIGLGALLEIPRDMQWLVLLLAFLSLISSSLDIATDGLAVRVLDIDQRGVGNGIQTTGGLLGNLIGGGGMLLFYDQFGWQSAMLFLALLSALPVLAIARYREEALSQEKQSIEQSSGIRALSGVFRDLLAQPASRAWFVMLAGFQICLSIPYSILSPMLVDAGWSLTEIGFALNFVGGLAGMVVAMLIGKALAHMARSTVALLTIVLLLAGHGLLHQLIQHQSQGIMAYAAAIVMMSGFAAVSTLVFTMMMDRSDPQRAGSFFSLQYCLASLVGYITSMVSILIADMHGYETCLVAALIATLLLSLFVLAKRRGQVFSFALS